MDFKDQIRFIGSTITKTKDRITTEEATKNAFIMPFIRALGYDVFNPLEVVPEYTADVGIKKGEKVDYAIFKNNELILLIECKKIDSELNIDNESQLFRYFTSSHAKFAILTNGETYKFYSDTEDTNRMDNKPFLQFDITKIKENQIRELKKFCKDNFNSDEILDSAITLKYSNSVREILISELKEPSEDFVAFFVKKTGNRASKKIMEQFSEIVKITFKQFIDDSVTDRLQNALKEEVKKENINEEELQENSSTEDSKIITTEEELEAFRIIKAILIAKIPADKITYKDSQSYFAILYGTKRTNWICRLVLNENKKVLTFPNGEHFKIKDINELYEYKEKFIHSSVERLNNDHSCDKEDLKKKLTVLFQDGTQICETKSIDTFIKSIEKIGFERVISLGLKCRKVDLISKQKQVIETNDDRNDMVREYKGYFIVSNSSTEHKIKLLKEISDKLALNLKIEI